MVKKTGPNPVSKSFPQRNAMPVGQMPTAQPHEITVQFQHLNADECEKLKAQVVDKLEEFKWGTYGAKRDEPLQQYPITQLSNQHLENILITQPQIPNEMAAAILMLLKKRYGAL